MDSPEIYELTQAKKKLVIAKQALEIISGPMTRETNIFTIQDIAKDALLKLEELHG